MTHPLEAQAPMNAAQDATGLSEWGGDVFREPLEVLSSDLIEHANLLRYGNWRCGDTYRESRLAILSFPNLSNISRRQN